RSSRSASSRRGSRSSATGRTRWHRRCERGSRPTSAWCRAASGRPTTTGRWSSSRAWRAAASSWTTRCTGRSAGRPRRGPGGASESAVAKVLAEAGGDGDGVEVTICARDFEIHVDLLYEPGAEVRAQELEQALAAPLEHYVFTRDERGVEELVLGLARARGWT